MKKFTAFSRAATARSVSSIFPREFIKSTRFNDKCTLPTEHGEEKAFLVSFLSSHESFPV